MRFYIKLLSILILTSCSGGYIVTTNMYNLAEFEPNSHVYTLPKTRVVVEVSGSKTEFIPGPYHQYAKKYLGIDDANSVADIKYKIEDIRLSTQAVPDKDFCFSVRDENYNNVAALLENYSNLGLILPEKIQQARSDFQPNDSLEEMVYSDLSVKPFYKVPSNLTFSADETPLWEKQLTPKNMDEKAQEAAQFIFKIRKRRFKLLAGQYEVFPEGIALQTSVEELNRLEEQYLSLFIGKKVTSKLNNIYFAVPTNDNLNQAFTLFRFSENTGFNEAAGRTGEAVILQVIDEESNTTLAQLGHNFLVQPNENILLVRVPDKASVKVLIGSHNVLESEISVYQFGALIPKYVPPVKKGLF